MYPICFCVRADPGPQRQNRLAHNCQWQLQDIINAIIGAERSITFVGSHWRPRTVTPIPSLQSDRRFSVRVPRLPVRIPLPGDPRSPARDRSAITTARCLRRAATNLQGRENSKVNTYVTTATRRYHYLCLLMDLWAFLYQFIDLLCPPVVKKKALFCHKTVSMFLRCTGLPPAFYMSSTQLSNEEIYISDEQTQQFG